MMAGIEIVDAHMHLWTPETHPWVRDAAKGGHPAGNFESIVTYLLEQYRGDVQGYNMTQAVHVQANWLGDPVGETTWLDKIADGDRDGFPQAIVGCCDLSSSDADSVLQRHCRSKRFRGIRQMLNYDPDKPLYSEATQEYLDNPQWVEGVGLLEKYGLSFELHILPRQMERAIVIAHQFPRVMFMVDHCGLPYERDPATMQLWRNGLQGLAKCPNVYCKVSGMFATDPQWDQDSVATVVQPCLDLFGMDRCVFASNFPVDRINGTFSQLITALEAILKSYTEEERHCFFSENARKFYRL